MDTCTFTILSLCSGAGGLDLGVKLANPFACTVCNVEVEAYVCEILAARMEEQALDAAPVWTDLRTFDGEPWCGVVDCITAGYPCQPFSIAGKQLGDKDPRHLWPEVARVVREVKPRFCFFENVGAHLRMGFEQVHDDLRAMGYRVKAGLFTAEEVGAPHKRERLFILAYRDSNRCDSGRDNLTARQIHSKAERSYSQDNQVGREPRHRLGEDSENLADGESGFSQRSFEFGSADEQSEAEAGSGSFALADTESSGARQYKSELRQRINGNCKELENSECFGCGRRSEGVAGRQASQAETSGPFGSCSEILGNSDREGLEGYVANEREYSDQQPAWPPSPAEYDKWERVPAHLKPAVHRMADGLADRVERIRACGNGVVPLVAAYAWRVLTAGIKINEE